MLSAAALRTSPWNSVTLSRVGPAARRREDRCAVVFARSTMTQPPFASTFIEASMPSASRTKSSIASSCTPAKRNCPSSPRVAVMPVPRTDTRTPAGLPPASTTCPESADCPYEAVMVSRLPLHAANARSITATIQIFESLIVPPGKRKGGVRYAPLGVLLRLVRRLLRLAENAARELRHIILLFQDRLCGDRGSGTAATHARRRCRRGRAW